MSYGLLKLGDDELRRYRFRSTGGGCKSQRIGSAFGITHCKHGIGRTLRTLGTGQTSWPRNTLQTLRTSGTYRTSRTLGTLRAGRPGRTAAAATFLPRTGMIIGAVALAGIIIELCAAIAFVVSVSVQYDHSLFVLHYSICTAMKNDIKGQPIT